MATNSTYTPGVCNIGPAEIKKRAQSGWAGLIVTVVLWGAFIALDTSPVWRLLLFFPSTMSASGFLQAALHFCAGFGFKGVYNVVKPAGHTEAVELQEMRAKDRRKALQITAGSALIGLAVAFIAYTLS